MNMNGGEPIDTRFYSPRTPIAIVDYGATSEAHALRVLLELMGAVTLLHQPGTPEDLLLILGQGEAAPPYVVLCGHGDQVGLVLGEYAPSIDTTALEGTSMPPPAIAGRIHLPGRTVINTACLAGREEMGRAFLRGGLRAYIAPDDYPEGRDVLLFLLHLFHPLLARGRDWVEEAWERAAAYDEESRMWLLHTPEGARRVRNPPALPSPE